VLQAFGTAVVVMYYFSSPVQVWFNQLAMFQQESGFLFSRIFMALFSGALPFFITLLKDYIVVACSRPQWH